MKFGDILFKQAMGQELTSDERVFLQQMGNRLQGIEPLVINWNDTGTSNLKREKPALTVEETDWRSTVTPTASAVTTGINPGTGFLSFSVTLVNGKGKDRALEMGVAWDTWERSFTSVTFDGVDMHRLVQYQPTGVNRTVLAYYLLDHELPANAGTYTLTITPGASGRLRAGVIEFKNVNQQNPHGTVATGTSYEITASSYLGDCVLDVAGRNYTTDDLNPAAGQTEKYEAVYQWPSHFGVEGSIKTATTSSTTMNWTGTDACIAHIAYAIRGQPVFVRVTNVDKIIVPTNSLDSLGGGDVEFDFDNSYPLRVNPSVTGNLVSFADTTGGQADSGYAPSAFVEAGGDTMTGLLQFSGTDHSGIKLINLTNDQKNDLTPEDGYICYDTTLQATSLYYNSLWWTITASAEVPYKLDFSNVDNSMYIALI